MVLQALMSHVSSKWLHQVWDAELSVVAQAHADQSILQHFHPFILSPFHSLPLSFFYTFTFSHFCSFTFSPFHTSPFHNFTLTDSLGCAKNTIWKNTMKWIKYTTRYGTLSFQLWLKLMRTSASLPTTAQTVGGSAGLEWDRTSTSTNRWPFFLKIGFETEPQHLQTCDLLLFVLTIFFSICIFSCRVWGSQITTGRQESETGEERFQFQWLYF